VQANKNVEEQSPPLLKIASNLQMVECDGNSKGQSGLKEGKKLLN
jgi:hypothetical protein